MSKRRRGKISATLRRRRRRVPPKRARRSRGQRFTLGEEGNRFRTQHRSASAEYCVCKDRDILSRRKKPCMSCYAAHHTRVFIVNLALHDTMPKHLVVHGGRYFAVPSSGRVK